MEGKRFDDLVRRVAAYSSRRGVVRAVAAAAAAPAFAGLGLEAAGVTAAKKKKKKKTTLCLNGQTIQASKKQKKKALKQGATVGECPPPPPPPPPPNTTTTTGAPQCLGLLKSCETGTCCGDLVCGDNFCDDPPLCCAKFGGDCSEDCDCCGECAFCPVEGTCECGGAVCNGECTCGDCCDSDDCPGTQICGPDGFCECPSGFWCGSECCDAGDEVCDASSEPLTCEVGGCPTYDYCNSDDYYWCSDFCDCVTSIEQVNHCTDFAVFECSNCTTDDECGPGLFCLESGDACGGDCEEGAPNFCVSTGCSPLRAAQGSAGSFRGKGAAGKPGKTTPAVRGKTEREGRKRRQKKGRRQDR